MSRKRSWNWIFGENAHINFSSGVGVAASGPNYPADGYIPQGEGCDTVSDPITGDILFHTNGAKVWNSSYVEITPAGGLSGLPVLEPNLSMQAITIVKAPGEATLYYLFFVANWTTSAAIVRDIRYRTVDVSSFTWGAVTTLAAAGGGVGYAENLTAALQDNNEDYWIITKMKNNNIVRVWPLTSAGVGSPIDNTIGFTTTGANRFGQIKVSPSGGRLALGLGGTAGSVGTNPVAAVWNFDNSTGLLSNERVLLSGTGADEIIDENRYSAQVIGIDFSPNSSILYINGWNSGRSWKVVLWNDTCYNVYQFDGLTLNGTGGAVQLGPDGRIYFAASTQPHVRRIYSPDSEEGLLPLSNLSIDNNTSVVGNSRCLLGLPVVPQDAMADAPNDYRIFKDGVWWSVCDGDDLRYYDSDTSSWVQLSAGDKFWANGAWQTISCTVPAHLNYTCVDIVSFHTPESLGYDPPFNSSSFTVAKVPAATVISTGGRRIAGDVFNGYYTVVQITVSGPYKDVLFQRTYTATALPHKFIL